MIDSIKNKVASWALSRITQHDQTSNTLKKALNELLNEMYKIISDDKAFDKLIKESVFRVKYQADFSNPIVQLQTFYKKAGKGDNSFMADPFYRHLRINGDIEAKKLRYKYRRNAN